MVVLVRLTYFLDSNDHMTTAERLILNVDMKVPQRVRRLMKKPVHNSTVRAAGTAQALLP